MAVAAIEERQVMAATWQKRESVSAFQGGGGGGGGGGGCAQRGLQPHRAQYVAKLLSQAVQCSVDASIQRCHWYASMWCVWLGR